MSDTPTTPAAPAVTPPAAPVKAPFVKKGNPFMPPRQTYHAAKGSRIKDMTEAYKWIKDRSGLTREEKSALAYFTLCYEVGTDRAT
jgi:hypothetical protein